MTDLIIKILFTSLIFFLVIILYRLLLRRFSKGRVIHSDYCTLYSVEENPCKDMIEFYFITPTQKEIEFFIKDSAENKKYSKKQEFDSGGHIIRVDSCEYEDGDYLYGIKTDNQETSKKLKIKNN